MEFSRELEQESFFNLSDREEIQNFIEATKPDFVFHLAAQALVLKGITIPIETFSANVMGTINLLDALLKSSHKVAGVCVVTTDKVYAELSQNRAFRETDPLGGDDPYSASKVGTEMVARAMYSKLKEQNIPISVARAGNVIGGGDWGENRLLPDLVLSFINNSKVSIRNPKASRPFQHVLDCLWGYILLASKTQEKPNESLMVCNFGPNSSLIVEEVVNIYEDIFNPGIKVVYTKSSNFERQHLELNSDKAKELLNWTPFYSSRDAIIEAFIFYKAYVSGENVAMLTKDSLAKWFSTHE
jgi:CDP-glucose 4,6-dehydratase